MIYEEETDPKEVEEEPQVAEEEKNEEPPELELKQLPEELRNEFLDGSKKLPVIISSKLLAKEEESLMMILRKHRGSFGYSMEELKGISPSIATHRIYMEEGAKPVIKHQRKLNLMMKEVVRKEITHLLDAEIIYPIEGSKWVSPVHCVPKKGGFTIVPCKNNEMIPTRTVVGYRMCIDFRKLNKDNRKDHYPLPFIDQMLERLASHSYF